MHCDDAIHNGYGERKYPICLRYWLLVNRLPAVDKCVIVEAKGAPNCFATYNGKRVRLVMASRFGDIGITRDLNAERGYTDRVAVDDLTDFSETP